MTDKETKSDESKVRLKETKPEPVKAKVIKKSPKKVSAKLVTGVTEEVLRAQLEEQYGCPVELIVEG